MYVCTVHITEQVYMYVRTYVQYTLLNKCMYVQYVQYTLLNRCMYIKYTCIG